MAQSPPVSQPEISKVESVFSPSAQDASDGGPLSRSKTQVKEVWKFRLRPDDDEEPEDWWFASTAIPLLAATTGPLANVMSIAALVVYWRNTYDPEFPGEDQYSQGYPDPHWCISLNAVSLVCGFAGNLFLLFNFTRRVRYIVALPATIVLWYFATGILVGITISMNKYVPPQNPLETYSQGFWHAIIAAALYLISSSLLMVNMWGYFLGHYTRHFDLTDDQRKLILQSMMFFIWLAGGAGVFANVCDWSYADALYFCDVTVLTVGFGDLTAPNDLGRGLVFPYSVGGIILLGLLVSSIAGFAGELGQDKIIRNHIERKRVRTISRSQTTEREIEEKMKHERNVIEGKPKVANGSGTFDPNGRSIKFGPELKTDKRGIKSPVVRGVKTIKRVGSRKPKLISLRQEKERFDAMRHIQHSTGKFKRYYALMLSVTAFGLLWCVGAVVFWKAEQSQQDMTYFRALYFCYVSLLTIGYGDFAPKSNVGKPFFIAWSLIAVPTMTILVSDLGNTVIASYTQATSDLADWTILPKAGIWRAFLNKHPKLFAMVSRQAKKQAEKRQAREAEYRIEQGFRIGPAEEEHGPPTLEQLAADDDLDEHDLANKLALAIRRTANDLKSDSRRRYNYEEWADYTRLIRFSRMSPEELEEDEEEQGLLEWDWIGAESPMMADKSECEWVLDRLCESLDRYMRRQLPAHVRRRRGSRVNKDPAVKQHCVKADESGGIDGQIEEKAEAIAIEEEGERVEETM